MNADLHKRVQVVVDYLRGSCNDIHNTFAQFIEDDELFTQEEFCPHEMEIMDMVDEQIFMCEGCGWVFGVDERGYETDLCQHCEEDE